MDNLDRLHQKVNDLLSRYDKLSEEKRATEAECQQLREQVKFLESRLKASGDHNHRLEKTLQERNDAALKRISKLVDRIDQFQGDMKIS